MRLQIYLSIHINLIEELVPQPPAALPVLQHDTGCDANYLGTSAFKVLLLQPERATLLSSAAPSSSQYSLLLWLARSFELTRRHGCCV